MKFYKCNDCGSVMIQEKPLGCCEDGWTELKPNTTDASGEKHVPVIETEGKNVTVKVGSAEHPMLEAHYITHIFLETSAGVQRCALKPGEKPEAVFILPEGVTPLCAYEYCNLHGFWKTEI